MLAEPKSKAAFSQPGQQQHHFSTSSQTSGGDVLLSAQLQLVSLLAVALSARVCLLAERGEVSGAERGGDLRSIMRVRACVVCSHLILHFLHIRRHKNPKHLKYAERGELWPALRSSCQGVRLGGGSAGPGATQTRLKGRGKRSWDAGIQAVWAKLHFCRNECTELVEERSEDICVSARVKRWTLDSPANGDETADPKRREEQLRPDKNLL